MIGGGLKEPLKKLPFTIPELVAASPCKSSDGILYTGKKVVKQLDLSFFTLLILAHLLDGVVRIAVYILLSRTP